MFGFKSLKAFSSLPAWRTLKGKALSKHGIINPNIVRNPSVPELYEYACKNPVPADPDTFNTCISSTGAMVASSGKRYGRSPIDKRVVEDIATKNTIWWGDVNMPISPKSYNILE
jgi:phosphoenolpyruvate carboxykinase (ATP)